MYKKEPQVIFRADGDSKTGLGHIMRSSSLMQMLQHDFECRFFTNEPGYFPFPDYVKRPDVIQFREDLSEEPQGLCELVCDPAIIVLDGYKFKTDYQAFLKNAGHTVVCIDDIMQYHFVADAVINHAGGVTPDDYSAEPYTRFYLGPAFSLVKPVFNSNVSKNLDKKILLICLGGADPGNKTSDILDQVSGFEKIHIVLGAANLNAEKIKLSFSDNKMVHVHHDISATQMFNLMKESPYAILSPSTICYEYMFTGGVVFLYQIADNQERIKKYFLRERLAFDYQDMEKVSKEEMLQSVSNQKNVFDKGNAERLKNIFKGFVE